MYPDDCGECEICGVPVHWPRLRCGACEGIVNLPRDAKGRWMRWEDMCPECDGAGISATPTAGTFLCPACEGTGRKQREGTDAR